MFENTGKSEAVTLDMSGNESDDENSDDDDGDHSTKSVSCVEAIEWDKKSKDEGRTIVHDPNDGSLSLSLSRSLANWGNNYKNNSNKIIIHFIIQLNGDKTPAPSYYLAITLYFIQ